MDRMYYTNTTPRREVYLGGSEADLALMPTMTTIGQPPYKQALAPEGSVAEIISVDGVKKYRLGTKGWVEVKT